MAFADYDERSIDGALDRADSFFSEWRQQRDSALQTLGQDRRLAQEDLEKVEAVQQRLDALPAFAQELTQTDLTSVERGIAQAREVIKMYLQESSDALNRLQ